MTTVALELPDDIETLKAMVLSVRSESAALVAEATALRAAKGPMPTHGSSGCTRC